MYGTIFGTLVHYLIVFCIFDKFDNKILPVGIASGVQFVARAFISYVLTMTDSEIKKSFIPFSDPASWEELGEMYRHGANCTLLRVMGWWAFDVFTQLASTLPTNYLGGQAILRNIGLFTFMIPAALSMSSGVLVGR